MAHFVVRCRGAFLRHKGGYSYITGATTQWGTMAQARVFTTQGGAKAAMNAVTDPNKRETYEILPVALIQIQEDQA